MSKLMITLCLVVCASLVQGSTAQQQNKIKVPDSFKESASASEKKLFEVYDKFLSKALEISDPAIKKVKSSEEYEYILRALKGGRREECVNKIINNLKKNINLIVNTAIKYMSNFQPLVQELQRCETSNKAELNEESNKESNEKSNEESNEKSNEEQRHKTCFEMVANWYFKATSLSRKQLVAYSAKLYMIIDTLEVVGNKCFNTGE